MRKDAEEIIFQQDNNSKHTNKKAKTLFEEYGIEMLTWPAQSPNLNPIEYPWFHLKKRLSEHEEVPKGIEQLWEKLNRERFLP